MLVISRDMSFSTANVCAWRETRVYSRAFSTAIAMREARQLQQPLVFLGEVRRSAPTADRSRR